MKTVLRGVSKFFVANLLIILVIMLLPVFLITDDITIINSMMDYLFNNEV